MKKILIIGITTLVALSVIIGGYYWYSMGKPLYEPGMVRAAQGLRAPLTPPEQTEGPVFWQMESDIKLSHFSAGRGKKILIVHGGPGAPDDEPWRGLETLTQTYQFHYYAQRGCGNSSRPIDKFSSSNFYNNMLTLERTLGIGAQVADIERIRRILGEDKLTIIGHSFGGFLASMYAAEFPERVNALVLAAPADVLVMPSDVGGLYEAVRKKLPGEMRPDYAAYLEGLLDFKNIFSKSENDLIRLNQDFGKYYLAASRALIPRQGRPGGWMVHAMFFSMGKKHDYRDVLKKIDVPVLVIHGADDLQTVAASRRYADAFANSAFEVIEGSGHFPFHDQPMRFGRVIEEFLQRVSRSG